MFAKTNLPNDLARIGVFLFASAAAAGRLPSQAISGRVYDSVAKAPLAGAVVQLVPSSNRTIPPIQTTTDSAGKYALSDVKAGEYILGFYHTILDSLAIAPPFTRIEVGGTRGMRADLGVPSPGTLIAVFCGAPQSTKDSPGVVIGHVYDAITRQAVRDAKVVAQWQNMGLVKGIIEVSTSQLTATTAAGGGFAFCGVPRDDDVTLAAIRGGDTTDAVTVHVPPGGLGRRALYIDKTETVTITARDSLGAPDTTRAPDVVHRGHGRLTGTVVDVSNRRPLVGAQVVVPGAGLSQVTDGRGAFTISGAPGGSQTVFIRAVGYAPERRTVELLGNEPLSVEFGLTNLKTVLDTIRVTASRVYSRDANGFEQRRKSGFGKFFDSTDVERVRPIETTRMIAGLNGVRIAGSGFNQRIYMGTVNLCEPAIFVDGISFQEFTAADLNMMVAPEDIRGLEVYTSAAGAPVQYKSLSSISRGGRSCGSIVVWTKRSR